MKTLLIVSLLMLNWNLADAAMESGKSVVIKPDQLKWVPTGHAGAEMVVVEGDGTKGPHHMFIRMKPGFVSPNHFHHAEHFGTVMEGSIILQVDGQEHRLPKGSYFSMRGKTPHATTCEKGATCLMAVDARGKWDVIDTNSKIVSQAK